MIWTNNEPIDPRIGVHDRNQFEMKLDYQVHPEKRVNRYRTDIWFFVPKSLGIGPYTYTRDQFYADTQTYIRFKTPRYTLQSLTDTQNKRSPLVRIRKLANRFQNDPRSEEAVSRLIYEVRLLGAALRAESRDQATLIHAKILGAKEAREAESLDVSDACALWTRMMAELEPVLAALRELRPTLLAAGFTAEVMEAHAYVDEFVSISLEAHLARLIKATREDVRIREALAAPYEAARERIASERRHRARAGYPSLISREGTNEEYIYRRGVLKKFVTGVLFLNVRVEREGQRLAQFIAAVAAGVAMLLAVVATIVTQRHYAMDSMAFVTLAVLTYMVKDRLKDGLRLYFFDKLGSTLADHRVRIIDPGTRQEIGSCRESMTFVRGESMPSDVVRARNRTSLSVVEAEGKPENVIRYRKDVSIRTDRVVGDKRRVSDINDIIRFNVSQFLIHMDDHIAPLHYYDTVRDEIVELEGNKVYHLNVVYGFSTEPRKPPETLQRLRVVMDKRGIRKLHAI